MGSATGQAAGNPGRPSSSLHFQMGEMKGALDIILQNVIGNKTELAGHDTRITRLEVWQGRLLGGGSVIVFLFGGLEVFRYVAAH